MVGPGLRLRSNDPDIVASNQNAAERRPAIYELQPSDQTDIFPENSLPAFLTDYDARIDPDEIIAPLRRRRRFSVSSQILAGTCGAAAMGVLYALVSSDAARDTFANAEASIAAIFPAPSIAAQLEPAQPLDAGANKNLASSPKPENQAALVTAVKVAAASPSRDDIKAAYQTALQGSAPVKPPAAVAEPDPAPQETIRHLDANEVAAALTRAKALIASGDVAAARLVLRHPADSGDGQAAMALAETYDPAFLQKLGVHGIMPDVATARLWYEKARKFGAAEAVQRLEMLASR